MEELLNFIEETCVMISWGDFDGMREPTLKELYTMKAHLDSAIQELKAKQKSEDN